MSESTRFGPVQVKFNDDGTLSIYQPDANRVLSAELARALTDWLFTQGPGREEAIADGHLPYPFTAAEVVAAQSTVGGGVITTSDGPVEYPDLTDTEREADKNAELSRRKAILNQMTAEAAADGLYDKADEFVDTRPAPPVKRRPGRPRKTT